MRYVLLVTIILLSQGCADRRASIDEIPRTVVGVDPESNEPRFVFTVPDGFDWNDEHRVWYSKAFRTSITLAHAPEASFENVVEDFSADRMSASNLELVGKDIREIDGRTMLLVHANRLTGKYPQQVCTVAFGTKTGCAQINAIYPRDMDASMKTRIETALLNSRYEEPE